LVVGVALFLLVVLAGIFGPIIAPHDPLEINPRATLRTFAPGYVLGTDEFGRDIFSRVLYGARPTLTVAVCATGLALLLGTLFGIVAGFYGGLLDQVIMRSLDTLLSFPPILLAMMVVGFLGPGVRNLIFVIGILFIPTFARLAYAETLRVKELEYVSAARALGATSQRLLAQHVLPNIMAPLIVQFSLAMAAAILLESGLSFLGLGVVPPESSWGLMIAGARNYMAQAPNYVLWPALVIAVTILAINIAGDALRDVLDPRLRL
jgi:peptide/nickel transport system permease protein